MSQEIENELVGVVLDSAPGELPKPEPKPKTEKDIKYEAYLVKFESRIKQWKNAHSRTPQARDNPPIVWDSSINDFVWMNRNWRRG